MITAKVTNDGYTNWLEVNRGGSIVCTEIRDADEALIIVQALTSYACAALEAAAKEDANQTAEYLL